MKWPRRPSTKPLRAPNLNITLAPDENDAVLMAHIHALTQNNNNVADWKHHIDVDFAWFKYRLNEYAGMLKQLIEDVAELRHEEDAPATHGVG